ncbi:MAG TPA: outer membrane beta-barrel protein [Gemmatimonadaceae bacterium]|nr:outer membrane beta-barrel protein [Gemmatimonadaceae bacterium]
MIRTLSKLAIPTAAALVLTAGAAHAQRPQVGIGAGASIPVSDLSDANAAGWHGLVTMGYRPAMSPVGFRLDGMYHDMKGEQALNPDFRAIAVTGNVVLEAPGMAVRPYLIAGAGLYNTKLQGAESKNNLGLNGGAGLKFRLAGFDTFVEARYHTAIDALGSGSNETSASFVPITFGVSF